MVKSKITALRLCAINNDLHGESAQADDLFREIGCDQDRSLDLSSHQQFFNFIDRAGLNVKVEVITGHNLLNERSRSSRSVMIHDCYRDVLQIDR